MGLNNEKEVDPTVKTIVERFSEEFLRNTARKKGVIKRERKIDQFILFWVLTLGVKTEIRGESKDNAEHKQFLHLRTCVLHALKRFKDLFIQDCTIIRVHESRYGQQQGQKRLQRAVADSPKSVKIYQERDPGSKTLLCS